MELDTIYEYWDEVSEARDDISKDYGKRLMNGCKLLAGFDLGFLGLNPKYKVQVKQSPYFLIMVVASLAAGEDPENKDSISDEKVLVGGLVRFGGMVHGHWQETYYLLAKYER